eukprot:TRINITY_DN12113_c0_g3_i16.p1 TRINITY_DN12113_c0_g3~~TRINITY_DN12113_c0_g3_i16.p1  ORF type:complete len:446 (+),score=100.66 TRINITY_DN12113_c0_g3_i16:48-1340(+)
MCIRDRLSIFSMRFLSFLFVSILVAGVCAKWGAPIEVTSYMDPTRVSLDMFTDSSSGVTYTAYCNSSDGLAYYAYLDNSGLFLTGPEILSNTLRCYHIEISGPHDGQHVFITMEARRSLSLEDCTKENNYDSCDDIFIFETQDGGQTWLSPKNVGGTPTNGHRRRSHKLLTNWNTPYLWLVYNKYVDTVSNIAAIRYDTKKGTFDEEKVLVEKYGDLNYYPLITVDESGKSKLVLFYSTPLSLSMQTMVSTDEGVTWKKGASIKQACKGAKMTYRTFQSKGKYIMVGCAKGDDTYFAFSEDLGATWSEPAKAPGSEIEEVQFCTGENPHGTDAGLLVMHSKGRTLLMSSTPIPIAEYKNAFVPDQLYYVGVKMHMNCYYSGKELKLRFMYQLRTPYEGVSQYKLYIIDNDDLLTTPAEEVKGTPEHKEDL